MLAELEVGVESSPMSDGTEQAGRLGRYGQVLVSHYLPSYAELVGRATVFTATTAAAGVAPGTAASTTPPFALHNPANSGKHLIVLRTTCSIISGTLGAGTVYLEYCVQSAAPTGGTALTAVETRIGGGGSSTGKCYQGSTVSATPTLLQPAHQVLAAEATPTHCPVSGSIIVLPGYALALEETGAAGTAPKVALSITWAEVSV